MMSFIVSLCEKKSGKMGIGGAETQQRHQKWVDWETRLSLPCQLLSCCWGPGSPEPPLIFVHKQTKGPTAKLHRDHLPSFTTHVCGFNGSGSIVSLFPLMWVEIRLKEPHAFFFFFIMVRFRIQPRMCLGKIICRAGEEDQSEGSNPGRGLETFRPGLSKQLRGLGHSQEFCIGNNGLGSDIIEPDILEEACVFPLLSSRSYPPYLFASLLGDIFRYLPLPGATAATMLFCRAEVRIILKRRLQHGLSQLASDFI